VKRKSVPIGRPSVLRHTNALSILALLREAGTCSRADLVRASGLSAPTVTNVVRDLLAANLIEPLGEGESSGGRPPDMIRFKARRGCVLGVQISSSELSFLLADLDGNELGTLRLTLAHKKTTPESICEYIGEGLRTLLRKQKMTRDHLLVLVVGVPAIANVNDGIVLAISTLENWRSVELRTMLRGIVDCMVIIENDINLAAQGERYKGASQQEQDLTYISIGSNVGAGIILNGSIHHGAQWSAGEIAYLRLPNTSRKQPTLYEFGELESVLTDAGILASWNEQNDAKGNRRRGHAEVTDAVDVLNLAEAGDALAEKIVQHRASIVCDIVLNLSLILNPTLILLGGRIGSHPALLRGVQKQLEGSEFGITCVRTGVLGDSAVLWGAIQLALDVVPEVLLPASPM
jgi:predicted NBD/HSP70 family sugar kinase